MPLGLNTDFALVNPGYLALGRGRCCEPRISHKDLKAVTRCDKSLQHIVATGRLVCTDAATRLHALILLLRSVAQIQTSLNSCNRLQHQNSVAATIIFTCHTK